MYKPIYDDLQLVQQNVINYIIKVEVLNFDDEVIEEIDCGLISGSIVIDAESDIRRTASLVLSPDAQYDLKVDENNVIWLNKKIKISIGIKDMVTEEYKYWANGVYVFTNTNATYDAVTNQITVNCSDMMSFWDGTRAGNLGAKKIEYPAIVESIFEITEGKDALKTKDEATFAYKVTTLQTKPNYNTIYNFSYNGTWTVVYKNENNQDVVLTNQVLSDWGFAWKDGVQMTSFKVHYFYKNGEPISYNYIRDAMINVVTQLGGLKKYNIDWLGEAKAQPNYLEDWDYEEYRQSTVVVGLDGKQYLQCFTIPYDVEFSSGTTVLAVLTKLRDLYENYETFFDENGDFYCRLIPSGDDDEIIFDSDFFDSILISEDSTLDFTEVKNVTEAWGKCFEPDWYTETPATFNSNVYSVTFPGYIDTDHTDYSNGDEVAFKVINTNLDNPKLSINGLTAIDILDENTEVGILANTLNKDTVYTFKIKKTYDTENNVYISKAYFQGNWEVHAMDVLTDGSEGENVVISSDDETVEVPKYSEEYFKRMFNCNNVHFTKIDSSPFTIQKLGILLKVYTNEDMTSDSLGLEGARQENYRSNRLTDNITIVTKLCPFADVNQKVTYRKRDKNYPEEFLVKNINHDLTEGKTTWELVKYYRLYVSNDETIQMYDIATDYIPQGDFVLYNRLFNVDTKSLYLDINLHKTNLLGSTNSLNLNVTSSNGLLEYGFRLIMNSSEQRLVLVNGNSETDIPLSGTGCVAMPHIANNRARIILNHNGIFINGVRIYNNLLENIIDTMSSIKRIKIYGNNKNYSLNKVRIIDNFLNIPQSEKRSSILFYTGQCLYSRNDMGFINTGFTPYFIAMSPCNTSKTDVTVTTQTIAEAAVTEYNVFWDGQSWRYTFTCKNCGANCYPDSNAYPIGNNPNHPDYTPGTCPICGATMVYKQIPVITETQKETIGLLNAYYGDSTYRYAAKNGLYQSTVIDGQFRENDPIGDYSIYPPGIYNIVDQQNNQDGGFTLCKNDNATQYYFAIADIENLDFKEYSDKFSKGTFTVGGRNNDIYSVDIGFQPKYLAIVKMNSDKLTIVYNKDYSEEKYFKSTTNTYPTEIKFGIKEFDNIYNLFDSGFSIVEPENLSTYTYFAIG